jgi:hypothetical protein
LRVNPVCSIRVAIPHAVQIAFVATATAAFEKTDVDAVAASRFHHCVHRLVNVADKMDDELQGFSPLIAAFALVSQHPHELGDFDYHAASRRFAISRGAVGASQRNVDVMPRRCVMPLCVNIVSPSRDGIQAVVSDEGLDHHLGGFIEMVFGDSGDGLMPFVTPASSTERHKGEAEN